MVFQLDIFSFYYFRTKGMQNFYNSVKSGGLKVAELLTPVLKESKFQASLFNPQFIAFRLRRLSNGILLGIFLRF